MVNRTEKYLREEYSVCTYVLALLGLFVASYVFMGIVMQFLPPQTSMLDLQASLPSFFCCGSAWSSLQESAKNLSIAASHSRSGLIGLVRLA